MRLSRTLLVQTAVELWNDMLEMATQQGDWEALRREARRLENEVDMKLVSLGKLATGPSSPPPHSSDSAPLLGPSHMMESLEEEIDDLLNKLSSALTRLDSAADGAGASHTVQRHREILTDLRSEFGRTRANARARRDREGLLGSIRQDMDMKTPSGRNRRNELYAKEGDHIRSSTRLIDEQTTIAVETREALTAQRMAMKRMRSRVNTIGQRFPAINSLVQRIGLRKRRDSLIVGAVVFVCTLISLLYAFT